MGALSFTCDREAKVGVVVDEAAHQSLFVVVEPVPTKVRRGGRGLHFACLEVLLIVSNCRRRHEGKIELHILLCGVVIYPLSAFTALAKWCTELRA